MNKKNIISLATSLMLAVGAVSPCVQSFSASAFISMDGRENWNSYADTTWYTGDKSSYDISTPEQLAGLSVLVAEGNSMQNTIINLTADIALNDSGNFADYGKPETIPYDIKVWTPIGSLVGSALNGYVPFAGIFNGNGHTISGMYAMTTTDQAAGLFGYVYGGEIYDVIVKESYTAAFSETETVYAGGIVGLMEKSVVNNCQYEGRVYAHASESVMSGLNSSYGGGIVGASVPLNISDIIGTIAFEGMFMAGGLIVNPLFFTNGSGIKIDQPGIYNCISNGEVSVAGNIAGDLRGGGIIGTADNCVVSDCYSDFENLSGSAILYGEIAGTLFNTSVYNCYYSGNHEAFGDKSYTIGDKTAEGEKLIKGDWDSCGISEKVSNAFFVNDGEICLRSDKKLIDKAYDINGDGVFSIADLVVFQKWLLSYPDVKMTDWHSADADRDKVLDVYDMIALKKTFIENKS